MFYDAFKYIFEANFMYHLLFFVSYKVSFLKSLESHLLALLKCSGLLTGFNELKQKSQQAFYINLQRAVIG